MIPVNEPLLAGRESEYVGDCVTTGWISSAGKYIERFERGWADYCGRSYGVAVANGTVALELAVSALELPPGSQVILPSFTIVSCLEAVLRNNLVPVLVDCDPTTYCMDLEEVRRRVGPATAAIMPVHIYGHPVHMEPLVAIREERNIRIVEDAAEAHGAECLFRHAWRRCGSFGDVSCFSFYANKNITCGEGGMVLTDDAQLAASVRSRRNLCFGRTDRFLHEGRGWNYRMTNLQAAVGCAQLEQVDSLMARKLKMAARYEAALRGLPLQLPRNEPWARSSVWMYAVVLDDSIPFDAACLSERLAEYGVQTRAFFKGMHEQPVYRKMGLFLDDRFPVTERLSRRGLYLPSGQAISDEQIDEVAAAVRRVLA